MKNKSYKAQTTLILIIFIIMIFAGAALFLLNLATTIKQTDYMNIYVHNLLLSISRTDTGYTDADCKSVSDLLACSYSYPNHRCEGSGPECFELANKTIYTLMKQFEKIRKNYRYLFIVEPIGFGLQQSENALKIKIGDESLDCNPKFEDCPKLEKLTASKLIETRGVRQYMLRVKLILSQINS